ncbi:MAG: alanine--tRNA ligase-related protein, partial [bacterium]|nr:alanine--tRNA ligase-related protein [bacterium]
MLSASEIRQKFLEFFRKEGHAIVPSSSLIPSDPSGLLTTARMQQFKKYYTGEADPMADFGSKSTVSVQKCLRTSDIDEVGDDTHLTFFEMLGNFSFGGYGKEKAIGYAHTFITEELGLPISFVTFYQGGPGVPRDDESEKYWKALGVSDVREAGADVFWGPTGISGPCGPTTEIYCKNASGEDVEIWNIVFNEYFCDSSREKLDRGEAKLSKLPFLGIDTGMGLERLAMVVQNKSTIFKTDVFDFILKSFPDSLTFRTQRILADHMRAVCFLVSDGVIPSNKGTGYILRRLL